MHTPGLVLIGIRSRRRRSRADASSRKLLGPKFEGNTREMQTWRENFLLSPRSSRNGDLVRCVWEMTRGRKAIDDAREFRSNGSSMSHERSRFNWNR